MVWAKKIHKAYGSLCNALFAIEILNNNAISPYTCLHSADGHGSNGPQSPHGERESKHYIGVCSVYWYSYVLCVSQKILGTLYGVD